MQGISACIMEHIPPPPPPPPPQGCRWQIYCKAIQRLMFLLLQGTPARILETRKTAPGLRVTDKWAVLMGGGSNHRIGLFDMVMIKDNHVTAAGGVVPAIQHAQVRPLLAQNFVLCMCVISA